MVDFTVGKWVFEPKVSDVRPESVSITTEPETDFWQRSYYGFRNDNAPALQIESVASGVAEEDAIERINELFALETN